MANAGVRDELATVKGGECEVCRSCNGAGYKMVSPRRSLRFDESVVVYRRRPCLECQGTKIETGGRRDG